MSDRERLRPPAAARERRRRHSLAAGVGVLVALGVGPTLADHVAATSALLGHLGDVGRFCVASLSFVLAPVHLALHGLLAAGVVYACYDRVRAWRKAWRTLALLDSRVPTPGDAFWRAALEAGIASDVVRIADGLPNPAFTSGILRPRIYLARALAWRLAPAELAAVVAHEAAHVRRRDPLRLSVLRFLASALFWLPALRRIGLDVAEEVEVQADDSAGTDPLALASAILAVASWAPAEPSTEPGVGLTGPDLTERRVRRLAGEPVSARTHLTRRAVTGAAAALMLAWTSSIAAAHTGSAGPRQGGRVARCGQETAAPAPATRQSAALGERTTPT